MEILTDVSEQFEFVDDTLVYVDAPIEGVVRSKTGELFAFRCSTIVTGILWHWVLVPVASSEVSIAATFDEARKAAPPEWISIVEDRRGDSARVAMCRLVGGVHRVPG